MITAEICITRPSRNLQRGGNIPIGLECRGPERIPGGHHGPCRASVERRAFDLPANHDRLAADAGGIEAVIVNGRVIGRQNKDQVVPEDSLPTKLLSHGHARP